MSLAELDDRIVGPCLAPTSTNGIGQKYRFDEVGSYIMASFVRALVNATHSEATMQVEIEFASTVGAPLSIGLAALTIVLFSFTYMDHTTKKTIAPANILRVGMGLVSIYGAYDFGFGHYKTYDERISRQVRYSNPNAWHDFFQRLL